MFWFILIALFVGAACLAPLEKASNHEKQRRKAELAYLKDIYDKTVDRDIRETLLMIANSILDKKYLLYRRFDEDTRGWWWEKIKESDAKFFSDLEKINKIGR